jgi:hypothetical protein
VSNARRASGSRWEPPADPADDPTEAVASPHAALPDGGAGFAPLPYDAVAWSAAPSTAGALPPRRGWLRLAAAAAALLLLGGVAASGSGTPRRRARSR